VHSVSVHPPVFPRSQRTSASDLTRSSTSGVALPKELSHAPYNDRAKTVRTNDSKVRHPMRPDEEKEAQGDSAAQYACPILAPQLAVVPEVCPLTDYSRQVQRHVIAQVQIVRASQVLAASSAAQ
jgi:hypothetical protein